MATSAHRGTPAWSGVRDVVRELAAAVDEHDILTYASAIAFQVLSALAPLLLFVFALLGVLSLDEVWRQDVAPAVRSAMSPDAFRVLNDAVLRVFHDQQGFWVTAGGLLTLWEVSGAVRAIMGALDRIYGVAEERSRRRRFAISFGLSIGVGGCLLGAVAVGRFGPRAVGLAHSSGAAAVLAFLVRYGLAALLLGLSVGLLVRHAPARRQPLHWVSMGTAIVVAAWLLFSTGFGFYLSRLADYDTIFGSLASVFVLMSYLYLSAAVFLIGTQLDAMVRRDVGGIERPERSQPPAAAPRPAR